MRVRQIRPQLFEAIRGGNHLSRDKADTLLLLGSCALVLLPHLSHLPAWVTPTCAALLLWRMWLTFRGNRMPPRWALLPIATLSIVGVYVTYETLFGREAGVTMLALLLTLKMLEMHAKRDLFVVLFLSFFLILASFFYSQSIGTAVFTVAAVLALLTTQISFQFTGAVPPFRQRLRLGATILGLAAPLTLVLFLLFPRIQGPLWGLPGDAHTGRTGMSDTMSPGNIAQLAQSDEIAFRVKFDSAVPLQSQLYWRGVVLGAYDGRTWTRMTSTGVGKRQIELQLKGNPVRYEITLEPHGRRWIFALEVPRRPPHISQNPVGISDELQLLTVNPINVRLRYSVVSHAAFKLQPNEPAQNLKQWLQLPDGFNPRTHAFAVEIRQQSKSHAEMIQAVLRHFRKENFRYTLEPPPLGKHVVDEFLFGTRTGFCEHYAGAFVFLMRTLGIPARVVTGYQGGEINPLDGFMTVRQSDAHAWTEVWLEKSGWVRIDPTAAVAPDRVERNLSSVIPRTAFGGLLSLDPSNSVLAAQWLLLRHELDALGNAWNQWVLNYTSEKQKNFVKSFGFDHVNWHTLALLVLGIGGLVLAVAVLPLLIHQQKRDPLELIYLSLCKSMERQGLPRALYEGPRAYAVRITAADSPLSEEKKAAIARFLEIYETMRYGAAANQRTPSAEISKLKSLLAECR